jgi:predicted dithiol-disulfide oxidoreductase (DUF899 family)
MVRSIKKENQITDHQVVSPGEWLSARKLLLAKEKDFTKLRDELNQQRRDLPWESVTKDYAFEGPAGKQSLSELFDGRSQLIVYHFMFAPEWDAGCPHCSFWADNFNGVIVHLHQRDTSMVAISRAPYGNLAAYEKRMGWNFKWLSSGGTDFNFDYNASFSPEQVASKEAFYNYSTQDPKGTDHAGVSIFFKDRSGSMFHTYSAFARGIDLVNTAYNYLDLTPKGRDEGGRSQFWVKRHDEYPQ